MSQIALTYLQLLDIGIISPNEAVDLIKSKSENLDTGVINRNHFRTDTFLKDNNYQFLNPFSN